MRKLVLLFDYFGPYHRARLSGLVEAAAMNWDVVGVQLREQSRDYAWQAGARSGLAIRTILNASSEGHSTWRRMRMTWQVLEELCPNVVAIAGYARPEMLAALGWSRWRRRPAILMSESKRNDAMRNPAVESIKSRVVSQFEGALVGGKLQETYLRALGFPAERIFHGYNIVGNAAYHPEQIRQLPTPVSNQYFLAVNRFIEKKNLPLLIRAYARYRKQWIIRVSANVEPWHLVLCGDGQTRPELELLIEHEKLRKCVHLPGFLQQRELLPYFGHASVFVHASKVEQWGLVINEAMAAGLPVIVSRTCGCFEDLVMEGKNGYGFDPNNEAELADLLLQRVAANGI